jgi:predicted DNA-binding protein with PD1-like motif
MKIIILCFLLGVFQGMCEILSLTGSFGANENGIVTVSLANKEGHVIGGRVVGEMMAATLVTVSI